jgi:hypothetical protein
MCLSRLIKLFLRLIFWVKEKNRKAKEPEFTRRQWYIKCGQIFLGAIIMDQAGLKMYNLDALYEKGQISDAAAHGGMYLFWGVLCGFFMGLTFWRMLEIYWFAKAHAES